ncbi:NAD-dependent epimerase/dehydratase family protein, partial [archaeon AH-315-M20]|nr:NAD-dependent epimerase/dehydratase family protein [archaeon AH-315-M20]
MECYKNILVTGAAGFIGSRLVNGLLQQGKSVIGLDNLDHPCGAKIDCRFREGDVRDSQLIDELVEKADVVYHLAAQGHVGRSFVEPQQTFDVNVGGTINVLKACEKYRREGYKKRLIFASSCEVYGTVQTDPISESHPLNPQSPYAKSKVEAERLCIEYSVRGVDVVVLRLFNTYGPRQRSDNYGAVIPIFVEKVSKGEPPEISGNGAQTRDFMYIDDALQALLTFGIMSGSEVYGEPINIGTGIDISISDLANLILKLSDSDLRPIYTEPRPNEIMKLRADISKARGLG